MTVTADAIRRWWRAFTAWRRHRPFWGGVLAIAAAAELLALTAAPLQLMLIRGLTGIGTLVIAAMLVALAVISWTHPHLRVICGVFVVILGLASFAVSNLGGFFVGLLLANVGGSLIFAWRPGAPPRDDDAGHHAGPETATELAAEPASHDSTATKPDPRARTALRPAVPAAVIGAARDRRPRLLPRLACVIAVVATGFLVVPQAAASASATRAEPDLPCPTWWPWCETEEPTEPTDPGDEPGDEPGDDDPEEPEKPDEDCDASRLPARPPKLGTEAAETVARTLAACLALPGSGGSEQRNLPTTSTHHPVLNARVMTMSGMTSGGVVDVPTADGTEPALEFTMDTLELADMDQSAGIDGTDARLHVINMGSTAVLSGDVRLYVQRMEGLIFGVVPIVLTADTPLPPIPVPYLVITQAKVDTAYTRADRVDLPDLHEPTR